MVGGVGRYVRLRDEVVSVLIGYFRDNPANDSTTALNNALIVHSEGERNKRLSVVFDVRVARQGADPHRESTANQDRDDQDKENPGHAHQVAR